MSPLFLPDDRLLAQCRLDTYRGSGPGGQKRNKTSNAVRLTHLPTGVVVTATECRSLLENKIRALRRLRIQIAAQVRAPIDPAAFKPPEWFLSLRHGTRIDVAARNALYTPAGALVLDLLQALYANPTSVAVNLCVSTSAILKLLESDPHFWSAANAMRKSFTLPPLTSRH